MVEVRAVADSILSFITHLDVEDILKEHPDYEEELAEKNMWISDMSEKHMWISDKDLTDEGPVSYRDYVRRHLRRPTHHATPLLRPCYRRCATQPRADVGCERS